MPVTPNPSSSPYPLVASVMNLARVRVSDAINGLEGDLLRDDLDYTPVMLNAAWRWLQDRLYNAGGERPIDEVVLSGLPGRATEDVALQNYVTWTGCSDGMFQYPQPTLPQNLIQPLTVWRRMGGGAFVVMTQATDGLPNYFDSSVYDWRSDGMYFFLETQPQDLRIRYYAYLPDLVIGDGELVPMIMCEDCLSARVAFEFASARGAVQAGQLQAWADEAFGKIAQRTSRRRQRMNTRRIPRSMRGSYATNVFPVIPQQ